ncbi:unnamed protein product [Parnassius apollo]|uniref:(apollo) hypothetical protein n=1 Tax=Parnassius apollo TaxID=110799 RepID=A0A8S3YAU1_PARAO|nr:unnamed protein product [Parnassius apollo]
MKKKSSESERPTRAAQDRTEAPGQARVRPGALGLRTVAVDGAQQSARGRTPPRRTREKRLRLAAVASQSA